MRYLLLITIGLCIASCNMFNPEESLQYTPEPVNKVTIKLTDSLGALGNIDIMLPKRYDTLFHWIRYSDCTSCFDFRYRAQPKNLNIFRENSFYWREPLDSVEQLTILHEGYYSIHYDPSSNISDSSYITKRHHKFKQEILNQPQDRRYLNIPIADTVENINSKYFSIFSYKNQDSASQITHQQLKAVTTLNGVLINFNFELRTSKQDTLAEKFLDNCKYYLRTVQMTGDNTKVTK